jgi:metal-dependent amidase/aminoacylase/carboxypeptidase family protein
MAGCVAEVSFQDGIPPVINDPDASARALEVVRDVAQIPVSPPLPAVMGADDMYEKPRTEQNRTESASQPA